MSAEIIPKQLIGQKVRAHIGIEEYQGRKRNVIRYYLDPVPPLLAKLLLCSWGEWLGNNPCPANLPAPEPGINSWWLPKAAGACLFRKIPPTWAIDCIRTAMSRTERNDEVSRIVDRTYGAATSGVCRRRDRPKLPEFEPVTLAKAVSGVPVITREWLRQHSPMRVNGPAGFLRALYPGEHVGLVIGDDDKDGNVIWRRLEHVWNDSDGEGDLVYLRKGNWNAGMFFASNPIRGDALSWSGPNLTDWRHAVVESDAAPECDWLRFIATLPLPVTAIYTSGGRSIHALVQVPAYDAGQWERFVHVDEWNGTGQTFAQYVCRLGADKACLTSPVRLTRLPFCYRAIKQGWQELLWLEPEADGTPIWKKETPDQ
jgi:hypothetical protein